MPKYLGPASPQETQAREEEIIRALKAPWKNKADQLDPGKLPMQLVSLLSANLPSKSLKRLLEAHPTAFAIHVVAAGSKWTFDTRRLTENEAAKLCPRPTIILGLRAEWDTPHQYLVQVDCRRLATGCWGKHNGRSPESLARIIRDPAFPELTKEFKTELGSQLQKRWEDHVKPRSHNEKPPEVWAGLQLFCRSCKHRSKGALSVFVGALRREKFEVIVTQDKSLKCTAKRCTACRGELGDPSVYGEVDKATRTRAENIWGNSGDIWPPNMLKAAEEEEAERYQKLGHEELPASRKPKRKAALELSLESQSGRPAESQSGHPGRTLGHEELPAETRPWKKGR